MKKIISIIFILSTSFVFSQSKMNHDLVKKINTNSAANTSIDIFVKGNVEIIKSITENSGGKFNYSAGDIAVIKIPLNKIRNLISVPSIIRIESYTPHTLPLNDTLLKNSAVIPVHAGQSPLSQAYDGTGIVVGYIDTGIDFTHPDFKDSSGKSRIKYLWDQKLPLASNTPLPYNYGQSWNNAAIDSGLAAAHHDSGHGTHVSGIGAGNGLSSGNYKGVAPKADIIMVSLDFNGSSSTLITDAVNYIYSKAEELGKPCVINASLGDYFGSHDGKDLQAQLISNLVKEHNGRAFIASSGNAGNIPFHLSYTVSTDTNFTLFSNPGSSIYFQIWADTADLKNINFSIGADKMSPVHSFRGRTVFSKISARLGFEKDEILYNNGRQIGIIKSYGDLIGSTFSLEYYIIPDSTTYNWRLLTTGSGKFDLWNFDLDNGKPYAIVGTGLPTTATMPDSIFYKLPDLNKNMVSSFQCLDNVITVANYTNRKSVINYNNSLYVDLNRIPGKLSNNSSTGPTLDGRTKPDIAAPGDMVMSCSVLSTLPTIAINYPDYYDPGGFHTRGSGTSMASPVVAGVAALCLQKYPNSSALEIKQAIISCASQDQFTGNSLPNNLWGYGKVNAFNTLTSCLTSVTEYAPGIKPFLLIFPNPSSLEFDINIEGYGLKQSDKAEVKIYNILGELVKSIPVTTLNIHINNSFSPGVYFCTLEVNGSAVSSEKLIIL